MPGKAPVFGGSSGPADATVSPCRFLAVNISHYEIKYRILKIQEVLINFLSG
jgi:hypothetical protein